MEPDDLGDELGEVPCFGETFAGEGMVHADDTAFEIGDVAAGEGGGIGPTQAKLLGMAASKATLPRNRAGDRRRRRQRDSVCPGFAADGNQFGDGRHGEECFQKSAAMEFGRFFRTFIFHHFSLENFEDFYGEGEVAHDFKAEADHGLLDGHGGETGEGAPGAGAGGIGEGEQFGGEGLIGGNELDDFLDFGIGGAGEAEETHGDDGEGREGIELLKDEFDFAGFIFVGKRRGVSGMEGEIGWRGAHVCGIPLVKGALHCWSL